MTDDEIKRAMEFILGQQAKHESEIEDLRAGNIIFQKNQQKLQEGQEKLQEGQEKLQEGQEKLQEGQQILTELIIRLAVQVEQNHIQMVTNHNQMSSGLAALNTALVRLELIVEKDREETRARLDRLESVVDKLVGAVSNVHRRVSHLEDKLN